MKKFWEFRNAADGSAELLLYGDISDRTWWGDEVTPKTFAAELGKLGDVSEITVRINSGGGDVFAAQAIGNLLESHAARVTARIDGLCASAATIIACHCDSVTAAEDSTYMIHPVKLGLHGYYDAAAMEQYLSALSAIKESIVGLYAKKTGREREELSEQMDATSWWTAAQAKENGFIDEIIEGTEKVLIDNCEGTLFVNCVDMHIDFENAPEWVKNSEETYGKPENKTEEKQEEKDMDIKNTDELREAFPELVNIIERDSAEKAKKEERERIRDIEEMALPGSEKMTNEAKYTKPISAGDYAIAAMKYEKEKGAKTLDAMKNDAENSGADAVGQDTPDGKRDEFMDAIKGVNKKEL